MAIERDVAKGWTLEEALRQLVPDEFAVWKASQSEALRLGRPGRRVVSRQGESNPPSHKWREKKMAVNAERRDRVALLLAFVEVMSDGQNETIILPNDAGADWRPMPSAQWRNVERLDPEKSHIRHKGEWLRVLVFPAVGAHAGLRYMTGNSKLAKKLDGRTLREAFWFFILDDPVIAKLGRAALDANEPCRDVFEDGRLGCQGWPARYEEYDFAYEFVRIPIAGATPPPSAIVKEAAGAFQERYAVLLELLRREQIEAWGTPSTGDGFVRIPRACWSDNTVFIDFANSKVDRWGGVELRLASLAQAEAGENPIPQISSADPVRGKNPGGRPPIHPWESAFSLLAARLGTEGDPETGVELSNLMADCLEEAGDQNPPEVKDVGRWLKKYQRPLWDKIVPEGEN